MKKKRAGAGRRHALSVRQQRQIVRLSIEGKLSLNQLGNKYGVSPMTIHRVIKKSLGTASEPDACGDDATNQPQAAEPAKFPRICSSYG